MRCSSSFDKKSRGDQDPLLTENRSAERRGGLIRVVHHSPVEAGTPHRNETNVVVAKLLTVILS